MTPAAVALADTNWQFLYCSAIVITNCSQLYTVTVLTPKRAQLNSGSAVLHLCSQCSFFWIHRAVPLYLLLLHLQKCISDGDFFLNADWRLESSYPPVGTDITPIFHVLKYFYNKQPSNRQCCYNFNASKHKNVNTSNVWRITEVWLVDITWCTSSW